MDASTPAVNSHSKGRDCMQIKAAILQLTPLNFLPAIILVNGNQHSRPYGVRPESLRQRNEN